jgi:predicted ATPase/class 3 adenylate cyclase
MTVGKVLPSGRVTFAFVDVVESTRALAAHGDVYVEALRSLQQRVGTLAEQHGGAVVSWEGDGAFLVFRDAASALECLRRLQDGSGTEELTLALRSGAHTGNGVAVDGDYISLAVNVAARVAAAAREGQVLASQTTIDELREPVGELVGAFELKGLDEPVILWRVAGPNAPPSAMPARRTNVPEPRTSFVGRAHVLDSLSEILSRPGLVTLTGPGGVGKTRVASEVALRMARSSPGGAWLVELATVSDETAVPEAVATVLGVTSAANPASIGAELNRRGQTLLIVDNCEHVIDASAALVAELVGRCPQLRVLATSREPLTIDGECVVRLDALAMGSAAGASEAEQLFTDRAAVVGAPLAETDAAAIAAICRSLDGVPLAIELVAARASDMPLSRLADAVRDGAAMNLMRRGGPRHHRTLAAMVNWTFDQLPEAHRAALLALSVLPGGFSAETACAILGRVPGADPGALPDLYRHSLIDRDGDRYRMLYVIRTVVRRHLDADSSRHDVCHDALFGWAVQTATVLRDTATVAEGITDPDIAQALEEALAWALPTRRPGCGAVLHMLSAWSLEHLRTARYTAMCEHVLHSGAPIADPDAVILFASALRSRVGMAGAVQENRWDRIDELVDAARRFGEPVALRRALRDASWYLNAQGDRRTAMALAREELAVIDAHPQLHQLRYLAFDQLGVLLHFDGQYEAAAAAYRRAILESERAGDSRWVNTSRTNLAEAALDLGDADEALKILGKLLAVPMKSETSRAVGEALLAEALWSTGVRDQALALRDQARATLTPMAERDPSLRFYLDRLTHVFA